MATFNPQHLVRTGASGMNVVGYRNQAPGFDPTSGEGARRLGGRFNPPSSFPVLYLCSTRTCASSELKRQAERQSIALSQLLPRELWVVRARLRRVLDLTRDANLQTLGVSSQDLVRDNHRFTQDLGLAAHGLHFQAIRTPSATGIGDVFALLLDHIGETTLETDLLETWSERSELD